MAIRKRASSAQAEAVDRASTVAAAIQWRVVFMMLLPKLEVSMAPGHGRCLFDQRAKASDLRPKHEGAVDLRQRPPLQPGARLRTETPNPRRRT
ncbi:hypothetical protein GCM10011452_30920 [Gemmobacter lanyuensis]|uniref:Uncharacterized protein n=1 Tax=Gemmobacter lanyuensis TaxID=1054497 RepID=A0A918J2Y7_9RHOB|nr:hypothetical protein GCM10011452_30920 [Gemmobacter lanyuensis]